MKLYRLALLPLIACNDATTTPPTVLNLERPVDVAFACFGGLRLTEGNPPTAEQEIIASAQPVAACEIRSGTRTPAVPTPPGQEDIGTSRTGGASWYAFVLQSEPGTVAVAQFETKPSSSFTGSDVQILDADLLTPGDNGISVGEDPVAIVTDRVGCFEVIANAGSCDLSTLDVGSAIAATSGTGEPLVQRFDVMNASGQVIRARPAAMVVEPAGGTIGTRCEATPQGLAYIAYPSCHLVAGVDLATQTIVTGIQFDANGVPTIVDGNVTCPAECDGAATTAGTRPVALDLEQDARTGRAVLAIGSDNSNVLTAYDLDPQTFEPLSLLSVPLQNTTGRLGITSLAVSPVIGMGGDSGMVQDDLAPGGEHQFIYAVATDGTVRVADISGAPRECDAQVDPRYLRDVRDVNLLSCLPVTVAPPAATCSADSQCTTGFCKSDGTCGPLPPRRPGARGPGIELIGDAIPTSVEFMRIDALEGTDGRTEPFQVIGYFAMVSAANGQAYIVNVDADNQPDFVPTSGPPEAILAAPIPLDIAHQLRDGIPQRGLLATESGQSDTPFVCNDPGPDPDVQGGNLGGPRLAGSIQRTLPAGVIAPEKVGGLPSLRQVRCEPGDPDASDLPVPELYFSAPVAVREEVFPDWRGLRADETWTLAWEGVLSNDKVDTAVDGPPVRQSQMFVDALGMHVLDPSRPFCDAGVEPYDVVQLRGCDPAAGNAGCPAGYSCFVHPQSQITGLGSCMLTDEAERLANACRSFLTSARRYTVGKTKSGDLTLLPRKSVLRTTPINGCDTDAQCEALADYAFQNVSSLNPSDPNQITDPKTWRCRPDTDRKPTTTGKRCLNVCSTDEDCGFGTVCQMTPAAAPDMGYCMEGIIPPQACVNAPQRYELRAGEAFAVIGSRQGYMHPIIADSSDSCVRDPNANPLLVGRIPLDAPACNPAANPLTGRLPDGTYEANPCKTTVEETEFQLNYVPGTCTLGTPDESVVTRNATSIRFRNRGLQLTMVDPTYQGDLACHGDRQGMLQNVPLVMPGFQLAFRQTAGFTPLTVPGISPALPIKVVKGPTSSFWLIDEGDFLTSPVLTTRGQVYRIESRALGIFNTLQ
jgi:hypothetical protein